MNKVVITFYRGHFDQVEQASLGVQLGRLNLHDRIRLVEKLADTAVFTFITQDSNKLLHWQKVESHRVGEGVADEESPPS